MNINEVKFNVYIDAIKRTRWFLLITTLLSCLLLIHMYLERFSYQEQQIVDTLKVRISEDKLGRLAQLDQKIKDDRSKVACDTTKLSKDEFDNLVDEYANLKYRMTVLDNTLNDVSIPNRSLPLLSMTIPGNDFLPIIGTMLLVFVIGVWLNIRSVLAAIHSLKPNGNEEMKEMIRLHFTFTGLMGDPGAEQKIIHIVQYAAIVLPCLSFLIAILLDVYSIISALLNPSRGYAGAVYLFTLETIIMLAELILLFLFTATTISKVRAIGRIAGSNITLTS